MPPRRNKDKFQQLTEFERGDDYRSSRRRILISRNSSSCAAEQFHNDASLEEVEQQAPNNSKNWQWTMEGNVSVRRSTPLNGEAILCNHAQSSCENCSQTFVGGTVRTRFTVAQYLLDAISSQTGTLQLLAVPQNENVIERIPFKEQKWDNVERDHRVEHHSKRSPLERFSAVERMLNCMKATGTSFEFYYDSNSLW
ncbi:uncharacterized protein TNCV_4787551 [Trichonephila clavipes]|nr:uncharacterized protein TNCV_4787551 [Trichonephila clavipes]